MRLIDADALFESLSINPEDCPGCPEPEWLEELADVLALAPTVDGVEVVRCKDCKHWTQSMGKMKGYGLGRCDFHDADLVTCNGYCYWAERRTDG